ncbi:hypothetical protein [Longimicrobium sp.]|uniref:hypothetical protein n=1 Tax=Longimicrobium sp. TaxID=2029185 RepID=UPI002C1293C7|nr:hypothetical protein [Longimicrobium sp.]HSU17868.1 hypothetical protein [Longimicrobium sp.]
MLFRDSDDRAAGHVFTLPPEQRFGDDPKRRPHFLLHRCSASEFGTLAHMTTKSSEERAFGAPVHEIVECSRTLKYLGQAGCFVSPVRLLFADASELARSDASYTSAVPAVRAVTAEALGMGTGAAAANAVSIRGRIVALTREVADAFEFEHGVVVTQHRYSAQRRWQLVVPILDVRDVMPENADTLQFLPETWDVVPERADWWDVLPGGWQQPVIDTARLITFSERWASARDRSRWLKAQIARVLPASVDSGTLSRIEAALGARLMLE